MENARVFSAEGTNSRRPHQGRGMKGRTSLQVFKDGLKLRPKTKKKEEPIEVAWNDGHAGASAR